MKFRHFYLFLIAVIAVIAIPSCKKMEEFSVVPEITYKSIYTTRNSLGFDNKVTVVISFTDGDGDIGYRDQGNNDSIFDDPDSPYYNNYVATYFILKNGNWEDSLVYLRDTILPPKSPIGGRLPYLTPLGKNKTLKGDISCDFDVPLKTPQDTFRLDVFIYDRALHKSNIVTTPAFILKIQ